MFPARVPSAQSNTIAHNYPFCSPSLQRGEKRYEDLYWLVERIRRLEPASAQALFQKADNRGAFRPDKRLPEQVFLKDEAAKKIFREAAHKAARFS